jgi:hypothetical protein
MDRKKLPKGRTMFYLKDQAFKNLESLKYKVIEFEDELVALKDLYVDSISKIGIQPAKIDKGSDGIKKENNLEDNLDNDSQEEVKDNEFKSAYTDRPINEYDKDELEQYALKRFGIDLDKRKSINSMIKMILKLEEEYKNGTNN